MGNKKRKPGPPWNLVFRRHGDNWVIFSFYDQLRKQGRRKDKERLKKQCAKEHLTGPPNVNDQPKKGRMHELGACRLMRKKKIREGREGT